MAPDHQEIKRLAGHASTARRSTRGCRFLGNVEVGTDITHAELMRHYTAVVYATGAQTDKSLGIPGEDLPGSWAATEFVAWYNGHPDYRDLEFDLSGERAVVIGNGNVAADVTRLLTRSVDELARTDVADHALEALRAQPRSRRSSCSAAAAPPRRRSRAPSCASSATWTASTCASIPSVELDPVSRSSGSTRRAPSPRARTCSCCASSPRGPPRTTRERRIELRFLRSPVEIRGDGRVEAVDVRRNEIVRDDGGALRARAADDAAETIECGLVLRSVGYRAVPLPDVPFDERGFVLPNERGRVLARRRAAARRLHRRLDQARADRHPRHQQARRRGDDRLPRRGPARRRRCREPEAASRSTRCSPSASRRRHRRGLARDRRRRARARPRRGPPAGQAGVARRAAGRAAPR